MNTATETCPTLEDLATFLDGKLRGQERSRVVSHLAACESCYTVFADAARLQLEEAEEEAAAGEATVVPIRKKLVPAWAWPIAAMLVLGTAAIPLYVRYTRMPEMVSANLIDPEKLPVDQVWERDKRGPGATGGLFSTPYEFLVGAHLVDLRLALSRDEEFQSTQVLSRILNQMEGMSFGHEQKGLYLKAHQQLVEKQRLPSELLDEAAKTEASFIEIPEAPFLSFGKWTEAGRLSALARQPDFFDERENRRFPGWLLRKTEGLDDEVVDSLEEIRSLIDKSESPAYPYEAIARSFERILEHYQNEADAQSEGLVLSP